MGVFWDFLTKPRSFFEHLYDVYKEYPNEPAVGIGSFFTPCLYVRDPLNIQHVLASDFNSFYHRGIEPNEGDVLAETVLFLNGKKWKLVRQSMTPLFTSTKLKNICVSLQSGGKLKDPETGYELDPTDELLAAQAFFFFIAGVEPTASAIFAALVELGKYSEIQRKLHEEIDQTFEENGGKMTYDIVVNMKYLDMVMNEAMRMHPPIGFLTRKCTKDTVLPNGNIKVEKGTKILTAIYELHHDPKYYPDPEVFDPERFSRDNKNSTIDMTYMPFGKGGRICVGMRYAQLQAKSGVLYLLRHFSLKTITYQGKSTYSKEQVQVRLNNVDVEFTPRF
ncbi:jg1102 [Pararge aegeria aegeria]|uniref:unspecific monooxygenase n=1 Tax=Pararge aegeria aegeria TaxID=348720 RepID=A0A8S4SLT8_9NEOP|nr:jg1102 [Pararge aegeria aegeria]